MILQVSLDFPVTSACKLTEEVGCTQSTGLEERPEVRGGIEQRLELRGEDGAAKQDTARKGEELRKAPWLFPGGTAERYGVAHLFKHTRFLRGTQATHWLTCIEAGAVESHECPSHMPREVQAQGEDSCFTKGL